MTGIIRIEVHPLGLTQVSITQPRGEAELERLWRLYRALRPQIDALERAAQQAGPRIDSPKELGELNGDVLLNSEEEQ